MPIRPLREVPTHDLVKKVIANSASMTVFDAIIADPTNTNAVRGAGGTTGSILGVCVGIIGKEGKILEVDTLTAAADNETVDKKSAYFIPASLDIEYEADLDAAAGTTAGSAGMGSFNMDSTSGKLEESSYIEQGSGSFPLQFNSYGLVEFPGSSTTKVVGHWSTKGF